MLTLWKAIVIVNVCIGLMFGRTAKTVSPTSPRDADATPEKLTGISELVPLMSGVGLSCGSVLDNGNGSTYIEEVHDQLQSPTPIHSEPNMRG